MSVKMVADFRRKPSRARQAAARKELDAYVDRELAKIANLRFGMDYGFGGTPVIVEPTGDGTAYILPKAGSYEFTSQNPPKPKEPLPMLQQPEREVTTFRGGKWAKPEKERHGQPNSALRHRDEKRRR